MANVVPRGGRMRLRPTVPASRSSSLDLVPPRASARLPPPTTREPARAMASRIDRPGGPRRRRPSSSFAIVAVSAAISVDVVVVVVVPRRCPRCRRCRCHLRVVVDDDAISGELDESAESVVDDNDDDDVIPPTMMAFPLRE